MDYRVLPPPPSHHHHLYASPSPAVADHHPEPYAAPAYSYFPDPNPSPNLGPVPTHESYGAGDSGGLRPPGVHACQADPYAPHGGYESHVYPPPLVAGVGLASYYYGAGGGNAQVSSGRRVGGAIRKNVGTKKTPENLEKKKLKLIQGGTAVESVRVCSICNVVCNSDKVFASHLAGEKHLMKTNKAAHPDSSGIKNGAKGITKVVQSMYCEVCKIGCNSREVFNNHKMGKKHKKNLQKLQESTMMPKPMNTPSLSTRTETPATNEGTAVVQQPKRRGPSSSELDLETKKQKVLEGGAAVEAIRVCSVCNVVCNSQTVLDIHIAGQKHITMVKKQQETQDAEFQLVQKCSSLLSMLLSRPTVLLSGPAAYDWLYEAAKTSQAVCNALPYSSLSSVVKFVLLSWM